MVRALSEDLEHPEVHALMQAWLEFAGIKEEDFVISKMEIRDGKLVIETSGSAENTDALLRYLNRQINKYGPKYFFFHTQS